MEGVFVEKGYLLSLERGDVRIAADSTMLRMVNLLIALSLGVHREQFEQRMGLTWPRPFLLRPLLGGDCQFTGYGAEG